MNLIRVNSTEMSYLITFPFLSHILKTKSVYTRHLPTIESVNRRRLQRLPTVQCLTVERPPSSITGDHLYEQNTGVNVFNVSTSKEGSILERHTKTPPWTALFVYVSRRQGG